MTKDNLLMNKINKLTEWINQNPKFTILGIFISLAVLLFLYLGATFVEGETYYKEGTEPITNRTFVAECNQNLLGRGTVKLYERHGIFIFPCETETFSGEFIGDETDIYLKEQGDEIVISFFFMQPIFTVPA